MGVGIRTSPYAPGELVELRFALQQLFPHVRARDARRLFGPPVRRRSRSGFTHRFIRREDFERVKEEIVKSRFS